MSYRKMLVSLVAVLQKSHKTQRSMINAGFSEFLFDDISTLTMDAIGVPEDSLPPMLASGESDPSSFNPAVHFCRDELREAFAEKTASEFVELAEEMIQERCQAEFDSGRAS